MDCPHCGTKGSAQRRADGSGPVICLVCGPRRHPEFWETIEERLRRERDEARAELKQIQGELDASLLARVETAEGIFTLHAMMEKAADAISWCCEACPLNTSASWGLYCNTEHMFERQCRAAIVAWLRYWAECEIEKEKEDEQRDT